MKKIRDIFSGSEGFTLIELLIVIVILGVLAAIAVPNLTRLGDSAEEQAVKANMRTLMVELEAYMAENRNEDINVSGNGTGTLSITSTSGDFSSGAISSLNEQNLNFVVANNGNDSRDYDITAETTATGESWYVRINNGSITTTGGKTTTNN